MELTIRRLILADAEPISKAFAEIGWHKSKERYEECFERQLAEDIIVLVAESNGTFSGYLLIVWDPEYSSCPEIQDLNVLPHYRRQGIATALMDKAEAIVAKRSDKIGLGVGLHPGYNAAQRLYVLRGYVPDGKGVTWKGEYIKERQEIVADDGLVMHFVKVFKNQDMSTS
ncbi:MAG: GNAT family N-acetyltransferase [Rhodothermales bacterium]